MRTRIKLKSNHRAIGAKVVTSEPSIADAGGNTREGAVSGCVSPVCSGRWIVRPGLLALMAVLLVALPLGAVNRVTNPSFAGSLAGWNAGTSTFDSTTDATGTPGSGSARNSFTAAGPSTLEAIDQCIATGPGTYTLGGKVFIPNGQAVVGAGQITVSWFSGPDCATGFLGFNSLTASTTGSFVTLSGSFVAPAGTTHAWVTGQNQANAAGTHVVNFDDFVLDDGTAPPPTPVPTLSEWAMILLGCALMFVAISSLWPRNHAGAARP
jgi:hypothetical protein